jgi:tetratricopeptide (TPR) repeat protein
MWKSRFAAAKGAYEMGEFRQCESLLYRAMEQAKNLKESTFATNTCHVGLGAVYIATGKLDQAREQLQAAINALSGSGDAALRELSALARRFFAEVLTESGDEEGAEDQLRSAIGILEQIGAECSVPLAYTLSDLATLYITQGKLKDGKELVFSAMDLLERALGPENPEFIRANLIYNISESKDEEEMLSQVEDGILRMQYQLGQKHPSITRALRWYLKKREARGETEQIAELKERFDMHVKALGC